MPNSDQKYRAYQLLRQLDTATSSIMNQVAYGQIGGPLWGEALLVQQKAFDDWADYAKTLATLEILACSAQPSGDHKDQSEV